jgi:hypothetical protein
MFFSLINETIFLNYSLDDTKIDNKLESKTYTRKSWIKFVSIIEDEFNIEIKDEHINLFVF